MKPLRKTKRWRQVQDQVLLEEPMCQACLADGMYAMATIVRHTIPTAIRPDLTLHRDNLQALCWSHYTRKAAEERRAASQGKPPTLAPERKITSDGSEVT